MTINWNDEPVAIVGLTKAVLEVCAASGLAVSDHTAGAIVSGVTALVTLAATYFVRKTVTAPSTVVARQTQTDSLLGSASQALGQAGPVADRARLCPGPVGSDPPNNVQTFTAGVVVPLAVAPESVGNAWDNAVAAFPGLAEKLAKNAPTHKVNSQPMSPEQYGAWLAAGALNLR